jgi:tetratricopeptide (TPR) repeat protein
MNIHKKLFAVTAAGILTQSAAWSQGIGEGMAVSSVPLGGLKNTYISPAGQEYYDEIKAHFKAMGKESNRLYDLAKQAEMKGKYAEAEQYYVKSVNIRQRYWGLRDPAVLTLQKTIGDLNLKQGRYEQAEQWYKLRLTHAVRKHGVGSYELCDNYENLARLYAKQNRWQDAANYYKLALALSERRFDMSSPQCKSLRNRLDEVLKQSAAKTPKPNTTPI